MDRPDDMQTAHVEPLRLTYDDFLRFPDDGRRHELIDGEHFVTPAPALRHQELSARLLVALRVQLQICRAGRAFAAPVDVVLSDHDVVEPDLLYVSGGRRERLAEDAVHGAPDLVVEILSPSTRRTDEVGKLRLYARFDIREYWLVDPDANVVTVYRRAGDGTFPQTAELTSAGDDVLQTPLLPDFSLKLRELFA
jgi:Uma2 family endonuclease